MARAYVAKAGNQAQRCRFAAARRPEQDQKLTVDNVQVARLQRGKIAIVFSHITKLHACHYRITLVNETNRSVISRPPPITSICSTDTAAMVGSTLYSRYCKMAMGNVVCPGATKNKDRSEEHTSELPSLMRISYA